ncbi:polyprenyl synthetase family protein [Aquimarina agarilytica]|uniref:polyprenyl synthetase family protein n=1 Tax=Aquimarina agarilytica TaxID=1087449 RepID=UPI00028954E1|nr:polyprenyl synthetase family protein [Aquimarina agarilytica]
MDKLSLYQQQFLEYLAQNNRVVEPVNLYEPIHYILNLGGKRIRPILTLMGADIFGSTPEEALPAALAVEVFHNFSLVHDDIMDAAPLRRGKATVHTKWDINTGILSGDAMLIQAYQNFEAYAPELFLQLAKLFSKTALEVCEGQQYDVDFETRSDVTQDEYLHMITFKTAVLVGAAFQMGAIVAERDQKEQEAIYEYGKLLGIAFQLQDDYLDAFGNPETFGKQVGGDIIENKKTYLYLKAIELGSTSQKKELLYLFSDAFDGGAVGKIENAKQLFIETNAAEATQKLIKEYTEKAFEKVDTLAISQENKQLLIDFGVYLMNRRV